MQQQAQQQQNNAAPVGANQSTQPVPGAQPKQQLQAEDSANKSAMQQQMLQLISQMAAQAQDPSTVIPAPAQGGQPEFQQPAPQIQGQSIQQTGPQSQPQQQQQNAQQKAPSQVEIFAEGQSVQGQPTYGAAAGSQVIQGGICGPEQAPQQPQQQIGVSLSQGTSQPQQVQPAAGGQAPQPQQQQPSQQQTMESLFNAISQLAQPQQQQPQQPQQMMPPQQPPQQLQQQPPQYSTAGPQQPPMAAGVADDGQNQQMQLVDILGQITKSLNTIKQAHQHQTPQQPQAQQPQQQQPQQQQLPQQQPLAMGQPVQQASTSAQNMAAAAPASTTQAGPQLNQLVLQLLSNAIQQQPGGQPLAGVPPPANMPQPGAPNMGYNMAGGGLPPPQPYQHEALYSQPGNAGAAYGADSAGLVQPLGSDGGQVPPLRPPEMLQHLQAQPGTDAAAGDVLGEPQFIKFFVGGVLYSAKEADVEAYFKRFGQVVDVAIMRDKTTGRSRGFAFVTFKERSVETLQALKQVLLDPKVSHVIQDRKIEVRESDGIKPADSFLGKPQGGSGMSSMIASGNDRRGGADRGGRRDRNRSPPRSGAGGGSTGGQVRNRQQERQGRKRSRSRDRSSREGTGRGGFTGKDSEEQLLQGVRDKVFVGGLDYTLTDQAFMEHFQQYGSVKDAQIVRDPVGGQSRGFGFVTYVDANVAQKLINETGHTKISGRKVDLRKAELKISDKMALLNKSSQGGDGGRGQQLQAGKAPGEGHHHNWQSKKQEAQGRYGPNKSQPQGQDRNDGRGGNNRQRGGPGDRGNNRQSPSGSNNRQGGNGNSNQHNGGNGGGGNGQGGDNARRQDPRDAPSQQNAGGLASGMSAFGFSSAFGGGEPHRLGQMDHPSGGPGGLGPFSAFQQEHYGQGMNMKDAGGPDRRGYMGAAGVGKNIPSLFPDSKGSADDGGYAKPMGGAGEHFGASSEDYGAANYQKVDFDKPLFGAGAGKDTSDPEKFGSSGKFMYSSSTGNRQANPGQEDKLGGKEATGQAIRTDMPLASELGKQQQSLQKQSGHNFNK